ncbi:MAG: AEC family transporter [Phycisphaerae bacterium]|nr:AEC family transporter [Phycisphaerae bacterium]
MTLPASNVVALAGQLWQVFYFIVCPMLLLAGIGYVSQRRLKLDLRTLTQLNFSLVVPVIVYVSVITAQVTARGVLMVVIFALAMLAANAGVTRIAARVRKVPTDMRHCMLMTTLFHNSGNYALPLQDLAFRSANLSSEATSIQAFYMVVQNAANFTLGILLAASGRRDRHWKENLLHIVRFPPVYALVLAIATVQVRNALGTEQAARLAEALRPFWDVVLYIKGAFVAVALYTLGAQLAAIRRVKSDYPIKTSVVLRLLVAPIIALGMVYLLDLRGLMAQVLLIATTTPTAVNTMLLCLEFDNHPDFAARAVLYSTAISPLTVTGVIFLAQGTFLARLELRPADQSTPAAVTTRSLAPVPPAPSDLDNCPGGDIIARRLGDKERTHHAIRRNAAGPQCIGSGRLQAEAHRSGHHGRTGTYDAATYSPG